MAAPPDRPLLTRLRVKNFRSLADVDLELGPLTVLVGPNGVGKSNVVDALRFLRDAATHGLAQALFDWEGISAIRRRSKDGPLDVSIEVEVRERAGAVNYGLVLVGRDDAPHRVKREWISVSINAPTKDRVRLEVMDGQWSHPKKLRMLPIDAFVSSSGGLALLGESASVPLLLMERESREVGEALQISHRSSEFTERVQSSAFYDLTPMDLRAPQRLLTTAPLNEEGENLSAVLAHIAGRPDGPDVATALGKLVEGVQGFHVRNVGSYLVTELLYEDGTDGEPLASELAQESDGTLRLLGILAALYQDPPRSLVAIEEPETGIHPGALGVLADVFMEASTRTQVLLTTHSPDLIDRLPVEAIRVVEKVDGATVVGPVREGQREAVKQKLFSPGELMRMQGLQRDDA